jgi:Bacteriophage head to tail connecting protein
MAVSTSVAVYNGGISTPAPTKPRTISNEEQEVFADILREFSQYQVWKNTYSQQCEETAQLILPTSRNTFFYESFNWPGQKKAQQQIDSTGALALHRFCAIADSLVTPRNMLWHGLQGDPYVMKDRASALWFERTTRTLFRERYQMTAGFPAQNYNNWQGLGAFGNSTMFIDRLDSRWGPPVRGLRYKGVPFGETFFGQNHQGQVDRIIRWFKLTAYQAVQKWGRANLPGNLEASLNENSMWPYNFLHCVRPRDEFDPERLDARSMPFSSHYVSLEGRCLMQPESGYRVFPYAVSRYDQAPGEVYGRGPAQIVLASLKTLNAEKTVFLKQGHRAGDPVLLLSDDGIVGMSLRPGAQNKGGVNKDGRPLVHVLPAGEIQITEKMMAEERGIIDDAFLVSLFKVLVENPNMTATQVVELVNEKGMLVAPTLGRQHNEYVGGMVPRELDLLNEMGLLEQQPPRLKEAMGDYEVTDTSPLARAARMGEAVGFNRWVENLRTLAVDTQNPEWLDPVDNDTAAPELAEIYSVPKRWTADENQIAAKRKARADAAAQQARIQTLPAEAQMISAQAKMAQASGGGPTGVPA